MVATPPLTAEAVQGAYISLFTALAAMIVFGSIFLVSLSASESFEPTRVLLRWGWLLVIGITAAVYGARRLRE